MPLSTTGVGCEMQIPPSDDDDDVYLGMPLSTVSGLVVGRLWKWSYANLARMGMVVFKDIAPPRP